MLRLSVLEKHALHVTESVALLGELRLDGVSKLSVWLEHVPVSLEDLGSKRLEALPVFGHVDMAVWGIDLWLGKKKFSDFCLNLLGLFNQLIVVKSSVYCDHCREEFIVEFAADQLHLVLLSSLKKWNDLIKRQVQKSRLNILLLNCLNMVKDLCSSLLQVANFVSLPN